jgi:signal transduction histidine kinase
MFLSAVERSPRWAAAIAVTAFALIGTLIPFGPTPPWARLAGLAVVAGTTATLARRRTQGAGLVAGLALTDAAMVVIGAGGSATLSWFAVVLLAVWAAYATPARVALPFAAVLCVPFLVQWVLTPDTGWGAWTAGTLFAAFACVQDTRQRILLAQLQEAQAGLAGRAAAEERNRIARELHDVIGHALTVSTLHISSARLSLAEDLDEAEKSLAEAERLTQAGLAEVRTAVGMLAGRQDAAPLPGSAEIPRLVEEFRRAGMEIECRMVGDLSRLNATEGLTVYRILQEGLTNAARHAPGRPVTVLVEQGPGGLRLTVSNPIGPATDTGAGAGLIGMKQRAEAMGGTLEAGPQGESWRVEAVFPA